MAKGDEVVPDAQIIEEVIKVALVPVIARCEETFSEPLTAKVAVMAGSTETQATVVRGPRGSMDDIPRGVVRLMFRNTFNPSRLRFQIEAIYRDLEATKSGFSGFSISGDVKIEQGQIVVTTSGGTYCNNVWEWHGWQ